LRIGHGGQLRKKLNCSGIVGLSGFGLEGP
jgi:hypothetical protein